MVSFEPGPRRNQSHEFLASKRARLDAPHVKPLNDLVRDIRAEIGGEVPWFDPDDGGVGARALFLLEAPGARATGPSGFRAAARGSGIVSKDNDDLTAAATWHLHQEASLPRQQVVLWNIVPWYLGTATSVRAATWEDVSAARPYLARLLGLLPELRVVVAVGEKARAGWLRHLLEPDASLLPTLACPHPSPRVLKTRPEQRELITAALRRVAAVVGHVPGSDVVLDHRAGSAGGSHAGRPAGLSTPAPPFGTTAGSAVASPPLSAAIDAADR